jgi:hypothetical protein
MPTYHPTYFHEAMCRYLVEHLEPGIGEETGQETVPASSRE